MHLGLVNEGEIASYKSSLNMTDYDSDKLRSQWIPLHLFQASSSNFTGYFAFWIMLDVLRACM